MLSKRTFESFYMFLWTLSAELFKIQNQKKNVCSLQLLKVNSSPRRGNEGVESSLATGRLEQVSTRSLGR